MSENETINETQTLGAFLRKSRTNRNLSLEDAYDDTRIAIPILKAIESDDFESMPAEAFCRGFYVMYAKYLQLNHVEILEKYLESRGLPPTPDKDHSQPPISKSGQFSNFAEPSSVSPHFGVAVVMLACLLTIAGVCWSLNWNPVTYISEKISELQGTNTQQIIVPQSPAPLPPQETTEQSTKTATATEPEPEVKAVTAVAPYHLEIVFHSSGTLTVTLDNGFFIDKHYEIDQTMQWDVDNTITLDMPEDINATIHLNGIVLPLPDSVKNRRLLSLPKDLL